MTCMGHALFCYLAARAAHIPFSVNSHRCHPRVWHTARRPQWEHPSCETQISGRLRYPNVSSWVTISITNGSDSSKLLASDWIVTAPAASAIATSTRCSIAIPRPAEILPDRRSPPPPPRGTATRPRQRRSTSRSAAPVS